MKTITSIDVGIDNLGLLIVQVDDEQQWKWISVLVMERISIQACFHRMIKRSLCTLPHTSEVSDYVEHLHQEFAPFLDETDVVLIERQPPEGMKSVEQCLFQHYRDRAILVHPRSVHAFFGIGDQEYTKRKRSMEERTLQWFRRLPQEAEYWTSRYRELQRTRAHDVADAAAQCFWHCAQQRKLLSTKRVASSSTLTRVPLKNFEFRPIRTRESFLNSGAVKGHYSTKER